MIYEIRGFHGRGIQICHQNVKIMHFTKFFFCLTKKKSFLPLRKAPNSGKGHLSADFRKSKTPHFVERMKCEPPDAQISFFPANKIRADLRFGLAEPITFETNELRPIGIETNEALE
jgi:hypothetical protein